MFAWCNIGNQSSPPPQRGLRLKGASIYMDWFPCAECARVIAFCGIKSVVIRNPMSENKNNEWRFDVAAAILKEAGVRIIYENEGCL